MSLIRSSLKIDGLHCTLGNSHVGCCPVTIFCEAMKPYRPTPPHIIYIIMKIDAYVDVFCSVSLYGISYVAACIDVCAVHVCHMHSG